MAKKKITFTLEESIIETGKELAKGQNRNFSNFVEWLILEEGKRVNKINLIEEEMFKNDKS
jgi:hypothetical protein